MMDTNSENCQQNALAVSEEVARQVKASSDPVTKLFERLYDLKLDFRQNRARRNEETHNLGQESYQSSGSQFGKKKTENYLKAQIQ